MDEARGIIRTIATAEDPSLVRCCRGHEKTVNAVDFSNDMYLVCNLGNKLSLEVLMGSSKFGALNLKLDPLNSLDTKVLLMMCYSMLMQLKFSHVGRIDKLEFGKIQCKNNIILEKEATKL